MSQPKKRAVRARKCKCKCHIKETLEVRKKGQQIGKNDTLPKAPVKTSLPDNSATFKIKIKKK